MTEIKGIIAAMQTAMHEDGSINEAELRRQINRQIDAGVDAVFCLGTNGEFYIMSAEEKIRVMEIFVDEVKGRVPVYAGTGCISTEETVALSRKAQEIGVDVLSVITPYFAAISQEELYQHYAQVAQAVDLPVVMYNIPARTGASLAPATVKRLAGEFKNIAGVKDSSGNFNNILQYIQETEGMDFAVLSGNDALILWTLLAGGKGGITAIANILPTVMVDIYQSYLRGGHGGREEGPERHFQNQGMLQIRQPQLRCQVRHQPDRTAGGALQKALRHFTPGGGGGDPKDHRHLLRGVQK